MCTGSRSSWFWFFFSSRRRHTIYIGDWSSDVCSSDLPKETRSQRVQLVMGGDGGPGRLWLPDYLELGAQSVADREQRLQCADLALAPAGPMQLRAIHTP